MKGLLIVLLILPLVFAGCMNNNQPEIEEESQVSSEMTLEEQERSRKFGEELRKNDMAYILRNEYPPAEKDKDLRSIVRFIFSHRRHWNAYEEAVYGDEGRGLVIDKKYGKVYYNPNEVTEILNRVEISAEYREEDLDGLIKMIEESGMRDWNDGYTGIGLGNAPLVKWAVGIEYDDGTIERHGVIKEDDENSPSAEEFKILTDYIREKGEEITARYNEENAAKGNGSRGSSAP